MCASQALSIFVVKLDWSRPLDGVHLQDFFVVVLHEVHFVGEGAVDFVHGLPLDVFFRVHEFLVGVRRDHVRGLGHVVVAGENFRKSVSHLQFSVESTGHYSVVAEGAIHS